MPSSVAFYLRHTPFPPSVDDLFEEIAHSVEVGPPADRGPVDEMALFRYSGSARRVVARAADITGAAGDTTLSLGHLLRSLVQTPEGDAVGVMLGALGVDTARLGVTLPIDRQGEVARRSTLVPSCTGSLPSMPVRWR